MTRVDAVFLDVDETLLDLTTAGVAALRDAVGPDADWDLWCEMTEQHYPRFVAGELDFPDTMRARMAGYLAASGGDGSTAGELETRRDAALVQRCRPFDDVGDVLTELRRRDLVTGLITNSEPEHQRAKLAAAGLAGAVDVEVISGEVGVGKPDPEVFAIACSRAGVRASAAVHVGDRLHTDAVAATEAGLLGVWLARPGLAEPDLVREVRAAETVPVITSLAELPGLLDARFAGATRGSR